MIYIQSAFSQEEQRLELVGRQGEGGTRQLVFDCADVLAEYPDALIVCAMQRAGDHTAYLKDCATDGTNRAVTLESADVAVPGMLKIELRALIGDDVRKSAVYIAKVAESLRGAQDRPGNPIADVLNRIDMTISRAEDSIAEADAAAKSAQTVADIVQAKLDNGDFVGAKGDKGDPGDVQDVQVAGVSVLTDGVATIPMTGYNRLGVVQLDPAGFAAASVDGKLALVPPTDAQISTHTHTQRPITPSCMDYAVKAAMCDGKGAAWTSAEQKAARERMGVDKAYELIESITTDGTSIVEREVEPNGTPYNFSHVTVVVTSPKNMESKVLIYVSMSIGSEAGLSYSEFPSNIAYYRRAMYSANVANGIMLYQVTNSTDVFDDTQDKGNTDAIAIRQSPTLIFTSNNIKKIRIFGRKTSAAPAGFLIQVYGVRA